MGRGGNRAVASLPVQGRFAMLVWPFRGVLNRKLYETSRLVCVKSG